MATKVVGYASLTHPTHGKPEIVCRKPRRPFVLWIQTAITSETSDASHHHCL
jgi:hypothetical protein